MPVQRGGDAEGVGVGDRFAQEFDQRVANARVLDACGCEKKLHDGWCLHRCVSEAEQALIGWPTLNVTGARLRRSKRNRVALAR